MLKKKKSALLSMRAQTDTVESEINSASGRTVSEAILWFHWLRLFFFFWLWFRLRWLVVHCAAHRRITVIQSSHQLAKTQQRSRVMKPHSEIHITISLFSPSRILFNQLCIIHLKSCWKMNMWILKSVLNIWHAILPQKMQIGKDLYLINGHKQQGSKWQIL